MSIAHRIAGLALGVAVAAPAAAGFTGPLDPTHFTTTISGPTFGSHVDTAAAPNAITLFGGDDPTGAGCPDGTSPGFVGGCEIRFVTAASGNYAFAWSFSTADISPQYDGLALLVDGVRTQLVANGGDLVQSGQSTFHANSSFGWVINCTDCTGGASQGTISQLAAVPEPATLALVALGVGALALRRRRIRPAARAALATAALLGAAFATPADARVTRIVIDSRQSPAYGGASFGAAGQYEIVAGRAFGELDPADSKNAIIQDIGLAPKNAGGHVEYITTFTVAKPISLANTNRFMIYQVVNRGGKIDSGGAADGTVYLESGWQADLLSNCPTAYPCTPLTAPYTGNLEVLQVPVARNPDGSAVTGPVLGRIVNASGPASRQMIVYSKPVPYKPASLDTSQATMTTYTGETIDGQVFGQQTVASSDWAWDNCTSWDDHLAHPKPDPTQICVKGGFNAALAYNVVFNATDPLVEGIGFAATRDLIAFFHNATQDDFGTANPLANGIRYVIGRGTSQSGNFLKSLIHNGFNQDESGAIVMDGAWPHIAARQNPLNFRFALPDGAATLYEPGSEGVLWYAHWPDPKRNRPTAGLLDRCTATSTCPKIVDTYGATEHWDLRGTPYAIGTSQDSDVPLPRNVRRYYFPGTTHGGGGGGFTEAQSPAAGFGCTLPSNPNPETDTMNALLVALEDWISKGTLPPASRYPTLSGQTLVQPTKAAMGFPTIPRYDLPANAPDGLANPLLDYDLGPNFNYNDLSGVISIEPPIIKQTIVLDVPKVDADGNEAVAGQSLPSVLFQAPLGTYLGWNITASGYRKGTICAFSGGYIPFAKTKAQRLATGDPRPSLEERYGTHAAYVAKVTDAANAAVAQRLLLRGDADRLISQATTSDVCNAPGDNGLCNPAAP